MYTIPVTKRIFLAFIFIFALSQFSCSPKEFVKGKSGKVRVPCSGPDYASDSVSLSSFAIGVDADQFEAFASAKQKAKEGLRETMDKALEETVDAYIKTDAGLSWTKSALYPLASELVQQNLKNPDTRCQRISKNSQDKYKVYLNLMIDLKELSIQLARKASEEYPNKIFSKNEFLDLLNQKISQLE